MSYKLTFKPRRIGIIITAITIIAVIAFLLAASVKIVDSGHRGVLTHWSEVDGVVCDAAGDCKVIKNALREGLHLVVPIQDDVVNVEIRTQKYEKATRAASKDLQDVSTTVVVNAHPHPDTINKLYVTVGLDYGSRVIAPAVEETVKQVTANFNAEELITKRPIVKLEIEESLRKRLAEFSIELDALSITDFQFTPQFGQAIEAKVTAQQQALTAENIVRVKEAEARQAEAIALGEKLANIQRAEGIKQAAILQAEGNAQAIVLEANAEKEKVRLITEFLYQNPEYIEWFRIFTWDGHLPETLLNGGDVSTLLQIPNKVVETKENP